MRKQEYTFIRMSPFSGKINQMKINLNWEDHEAWRNGQTIQSAMPYLTADEREFLMTGVTPQEWEDTFD